MTGALDGIRVLDLSRILAGPTCTQLLGDLGADVIKVENPTTGGDDTRSWGPPFVTDAEGQRTDLSAYFLSANRNKRSISVDLTSAAGQARLRDLVGQVDIVIENFKPGGLAKYGLDAEALLTAHPGLIYCSISGFGQTGPNRDKPGYDLMAQGFGGIMSLTGEPEGAPMKVGVGIADVMCGMYATVGILAALRHRDQTGEGQHVELALVDSQMAWLINEGVNALVSGENPVRRGNQHPNIVPYHVFAVADGHAIVAVGNDAQFDRFCRVIERPDLASDPRFATNPGRIEHRDALMPVLEAALASWTLDTIVAALEAAKVPVGPVNTLDRALGSDQAKAREMVIEMEGAAGPVPLLGNPLKFSKTPVTYRRAPPRFGEHDHEV